MSQSIQIAQFDTAEGLPPDFKPITKQQLFPHAFVLHNVLSPQECKFYIDQVEKMGWKKVVWDKIEPYRFCDRVHLPAEDLGSLIWSRVGPFFDFEYTQEEEMPVSVGYVPVGTWKPQRLNRKMRICKYHPGGLFGPHTDGNFVEDLDHRSVYTFMIYLNDSEGVDYEGGSTDFLDEKAWEESKQVVPTVSLQPKAGMAICFNHNILHQGGNVTSGQKYIMRTDVIFEKVSQGTVAPSSTERRALELLQHAEDMERAKKFDLAVKYYSQAYKLNPSLQNAHFGN